MSAADEKRSRALRALVKLVATEDFEDVPVSLRNQYVEATIAVSEDIILTVIAGQLALNARDVDAELEDDDDDEDDEDEDEDDED